MKSRFLLAALAVVIPAAAMAGTYWQYPAANTPTGTEIFGPIYQAGGDVTLTLNQIANYTRNIFNGQGVGHSKSTMTVVSLSGSYSGVLTTDGGPPMVAAVGAPGNTAPATVAGYNYEFFGDILCSDDGGNAAVMRMGALMELNSGSLSSLHASANLTSTLVTSTGSGSSWTATASIANFNGTYAPSVAVSAGTASCTGGLFLLASF